MMLLHRLRLFLYFSMLFLPLLHPAVYFPPSWPVFWRLFAVLPGAMVLAFALSRAAGHHLVAQVTTPSPAKTLPPLGIAGTLVLGCLFLQGFEVSALWTILLGTIAFLLNLGIYTARFWAAIVLEPLFWAWGVFRILGFSAASVQVAERSREIFPFLSAMAVAGVLLLLWAIFKTRSTGRGMNRKPGTRARAGQAAIGASIVLLAFAAGMAALPGLLAPEHFENPLAEALQPKPKAVPGTTEGGDPDGRLEGKERGLYEAPGGEWGDTGRQTRPGQQSLVMVAESPRSTAYLAQYYYVDLDPQGGFLIDQEEALNRLPGDRYLETWTNSFVDIGRSRRAEWISLWSVSPQRAAAYWPYQLEPAVRDLRYAPLSYHYRVLSLFSSIGPGQVGAYLPPYPAASLESMARYLELPLTPEDLGHFQRHLDSFLDSNSDLGTTITSLLQSFSHFQYKAGFSDDVRIPALASFISDTRTGDCSEFSNAAAILARLAGIPSRVVTGYLLSDKLQTGAHRQGLEELRSRIPSLAEIDPSRLYLISDAHRHSWVQLFLPQYGWVDFEATSYALPPEGEDDPNSLALVIPEITPVTIPSTFLYFADLLQVLVFLGLILLAFWYCRRWALLFRLLRLAQIPGESGARALEKLVLISASARGRPAKRPDQTLKEYAGSAPEIANFAGIYTTARYQTDPAALDLAYPDLAAEYLRIERSGPSFIRRSRLIFRPWDGGIL